MPDFETVTYGGERMIVTSPSSAPLAKDGKGYVFAIAHIGNVRISPIGEEKIPVLIYPDDTLIHRYNLYKMIDEKAVTIGGHPAIWMEYKKEYIKCLNQSDPYAIQWQILCDFIGGKTVLTEINVDLYEHLMNQGKLVQALRKELALKELEIDRLQRLGEQQIKYFQKKLRMVTEKKKEEEEEDEEPEK